MQVMKRKTRMISVRLTEDEYETLQQLCRLQGARSVSDLTRDAMKMLMEGAFSPREKRRASRKNSSIEAKIRAMDNKMKALGDTVEKLVRAVGVGSGDL